LVALAINQQFGGKQKVSTELGNIPTVYGAGVPATGVTKVGVTTAFLGSCGAQLI
jgi:hypothetical protein